MRMRITIPVILLLLLVFPGLVLAQTITPDVEGLIGKDKVTSGHLLGARASSIAMEQLSFNKGDENVLAMTNAGYAIINGQTTEKCIDGVIAASGCTPGSGNLLLIHRSKEMPLWFAFFKKDTKEFIYLQVNNQTIDKSVTEFCSLPNQTIFNIIARENIDLNNSLKDAEKWNEKIKAKVFGGNESSLIGIASAWAHPGCTYDYLQAAQLHNHICPGVTSGYLIIKYLDKHLPLRQGQSYKIISCPVWCKEDAFQAILDTTPGKRSLYAKDLTDEQKAALPEAAKNVAGLYIRWDGKTNTGDGLVLGFDFDQANKLAGAENFPGPFVKINTALTMMNYVNKPETMVTTIKQFKISNASELAQLQTAGVNPLVKVGLLN